MTAVQEVLVLSVGFAVVLFVVELGIEYYKTYKSDRRK